MGEPPVGIEPTTPSLPWRCSATELQGRRGYRPRRVNDSQARGRLPPPRGLFATSTVPSADADPTRRAGRRRGHPGHLQRRGAREHQYLRHGAPQHGRAGGLDPGAQRGPPGPGGRRAPEARGTGRIGANGRDRPRLRLPLPFRDRSGYSATAENSVYVDRAQRGKGVGKALLAELLVLASGPRLPLGDRPDRRRTTRPPSACTRRRASSWSASSARSGASTANGSTWWSCSASCERAPRRRGSGLDAALVGRQGRQAASGRCATRSSRCPSGHDGHGPEHHDGQDHAGRVRVHQLAAADRSRP